MTVFQHADKPISPWFARPSPISGKKVAIVGAGLAGLMTAYHLREHSFDISLFDENASLPNPQCQNPALLLRPCPSPDSNFLDQYYTAGFVGMSRFIKTHALAALITEGSEPLMQGVNPYLLSEILLQHAAPELHLGKNVDPETLSADFDAVIIATGSYRGMGEATPGQVSIAAETAVSQKLQRPLSYKGGYCVPDGQGRWILGSSFRHDGAMEISAKDHLQNLASLAKVAPDLARSFATQTLKAFVGMRFTTRDHLPIIGGLPLKAEWHAAYQRLRFGDRRMHYPPAPYQTGIYLNLAHGSKGLSSSFLASKIMVSLLTGEPLPISHSLWEAIHPARFWLRTLKCAT